MEARRFLTQMKTLAGHVQLKALDTFVPRLTAWGGMFVGLTRTRYDYAGEINRGLTSSSVMPAIQWLQRTFPEAQLVVQEQQGEDYETISPHPLTDVVSRPNAFYDGGILWMATILDWCWAGEAFWRILRTQGGQPGELWWIPPWSITPQYPLDNSEFIAHYDYSPDGGPAQRLELDEVIHFRHGLDPMNPRRGLPPLRSVIREIWTDDESSNFCAALLRNSAVTSTLITPDPAAGEGAMLSPTQVEAIKAYIQERFTGDERGAPMAIQGPMKVQRLGFAPNELDLSAVRNVAEERVCAALGIRAAVVGYGTGLEQTRVGATMTEERRMCWTDGLIPVQRIMAATLAQKLLPRFEVDTERFRLDWDYSQVAALAEDENTKADRYIKMLAAGGIMRSEFRMAMGFEVEPRDEVYHLPTSIIEVGPGAPEPPPVRAVTGNGNGNGNGRPADEAEDQEAASAHGDVWHKQAIDDLIAITMRQRQPPRLRRAPRQLARVVQRFEQDAPGLSLAMQQELTPIFDELGRQAAAAASTVLNQKQSAEEIMDVLRIQQGIHFLELAGLLLNAYQRHYSRVADSTFTAVGESLVLSTDIPDPIMRAILATGGRRAGLVDLQQQTRDALFRELTEGRAAGEGVDQLVRRIRDQIPAGPWRDAQTRAVTIARTETRYAQGTSSLIRAREVDGIRHAMVFDARLGPTDAECEAMQGIVVTLEEARALNELEHPRGTRQFVGLPAVLFDELTAAGRIATSP